MTWQFPFPAHTAALVANVTGSSAQPSSVSQTPEE